MLLIRSLHSTTLLYSNSYYTVVASIFLVSAASCKPICGKYTNVLICISEGKGSSYFIFIMYCIHMAKKSFTQPMNELVNIEVFIFGCAMTLIYAHVYCYTITFC